MTIYPAQECSFQIDADIITYNTNFVLSDKNYLYNISDISYGFDNICSLTQKNIY